MPTTDALRSLRIEEQDLSSADLTLEADTNESYMVKDFGIDGADADSLAEVTIGEESMFVFPAADGTDTLFREDSLQRDQMSLYGYMRSKGLPAPMLQVPEGDTLSIGTDTSSGTATILYREGGANLASPSSPGGPETKQRVYPVTGEGTETSVSASTQTTLEVESSRQPAQYDDFPFGTDVPSNREFDLLALAMTLTASGGSGGTIDSFRLNSEEQFYLENDQGFVDADLAQYPAQDANRGVLVFPQESPGPQQFEPGDELDLEIQATNGDSQADVTVQATFIFNRRPV